jgi:hypothetical protein
LEIQVLEKKFGHRPAILGFAQLPTHDLIIGELKSIHVPLKETGSLHISVCPVDFGAEKKKEEKKTGPVEFDSKKFDAFLVPPLLLSLFCFSLLSMCPARSRVPVHLSSPIAPSPSLLIHSQDEMGLKGAHREAMLKMPIDRKLELMKQQSGEVTSCLIT